MIKFKKLSMLTLLTGSIFTSVYASTTLSPSATPAQDESITALADPLTRIDDTPLAKLPSQRAAIPRGMMGAAHELYHSAPAAVEPTTKIRAKSTITAETNPTVVSRRYTAQSSSPPQPLKLRKLSVFDVIPGLPSTPLSLSSVSTALLTPAPSSQTSSAEMHPLSQFESSVALVPQSVMAEEKIPVFTAIGAVFPGGAARILVSLIILDEYIKTIESDGKKYPRQALFHYGAGVSAGSILMAGYFLRKDPNPGHPDYNKPKFSIPELFKLYRDMSQVSFSKYRHSSFGGTRKPRYDKKPLHTLLENAFSYPQYPQADGTPRPATLVDTLVPVYITAVEKTTAEVHFFSTIDAMLSRKEGSENFAGDDYRLADVLMASSAAPTQFDPHPVSSVYELEAYKRGETSKLQFKGMLDGGVALNDPTLFINNGPLQAHILKVRKLTMTDDNLSEYPNYSEFLKIFSTRSTTIRPLLITFDTGDRESFSFSGKESMGLSSLLRDQRGLKLIWEAQKSGTSKTMESSPTTYKRLSVPLPKELYGFNLSQTQIRELSEWTQEYIETTLGGDIIKLTRLMQDHLNKIYPQTPTDLSPEEIYSQTLKEFEIKFCHTAMRHKISNAVYQLTGKSLEEIDEIALGILMKKFLSPDLAQMRQFLELSPQDIQDIFVQERLRVVGENIFAILQQRGFKISSSTSYSALPQLVADCILRPYLIRHRGPEQLRGLEMLQSPRSASSPTLPVGVTTLKIPAAQEDESLPAQASSARSQKSSRHLAPQLPLSACYSYSPSPRESFEDE